MGLPLLFFTLALFWIALHRFIGSSSSRTRSLLPSHALTRRPKFDVTLKGIHLRVEYFGLNNAHAAFTRWLANGNHAVLRRAVMFVYECGVVIGVLGMLAALGITARIAMQLAFALLYDSASNIDPSDITNATALLHKRTPVDIPIASPVSEVAPSSPSLPLDVHLLIPGVTLPLSALAPLLLALAFSQAFHELGHAICAAIDRVPLSSTGFSLTLIIPAFFVALPSPLPARSAPRIATAGALHNLLLLGIFSIPFSFMWPLLGFEDISPRGAGVVGVDAFDGYSGEAAGGLSAALAPGDVVVGLDDVTLAGYGVSAWDAYFAQPLAPDAQAWCVDSTLFSSHLAAPSTDCQDGSVMFFSATTGDTQAACLDPVPIFAGSNPGRRSPCETGMTSVLPATSPAIMRITLEDGRVVLWRGPREEIYEQVRVSNLFPRGFTPLGYTFPEAVDMFVSYVRALTLSLFLFNLLPLPQLDGAQLLDALLDLWAARSDDDAELSDVERGVSSLSTPRGALRATGKHGRRTLWARRVARGARAATLGLMGACGVTGTLLALKHGL